MSKLKTPREKKLASLALDRRNAFGENDKSSRKNIPLSKQRSHQAVRRAAKQPLALITGANEDHLMQAESQVRDTIKFGERRSFRKRPDASLGEVLEHQRTGDWTPKY